MQVIPITCNMKTNSINVNNTCKNTLFFCIIGRYISRRGPVNEWYRTSQEPYAINIGLSVVLPHSIWANTTLRKNKLLQQCNEKRAHRRTCPCMFHISLTNVMDIFNFYFRTIWKRLKDYVGSWENQQMNRTVSVFPLSHHLSEQKQSKRK